MVVVLTGRPNLPRLLDIRDQTTLLKVNQFRYPFSFFLFRNLSCPALNELFLNTILSLGSLLIVCTCA